MAPLQDVSNKSSDAFVENLSDADLMQAYGALLRARIRDDDRQYLQSDTFKRLQREVSVRNLVTKKTSEQIAHGIVYLAMPIEQMMASVDDVEIYDQAEFDRFIVKMYRSKSQKPKASEYFPFKPLHALAATFVSDYEIFLTCTNKNQLQENLTGFLSGGVQQPIHILAILRQHKRFAQISPLTSLMPVPRKVWNM